MRSAESKARRAAYNRARYAANKEHHAELTRRWYVENREQKLAKNREWQLANKERVAELSRQSHRVGKRVEYFKRYQAANREKLAEYAREYYDTNRDKVAAYHRQWYVANREKKTAQGREWEKENPEKRVAIVAARRARKRMAMPSWLTAQQLQEMEQIYNVAQGWYEVDHIVPLKGRTVCGLHVPWNLQVLEQEENRIKGNSLLSEEHLIDYKAPGYDGVRKKLLGKKAA